MHSNEVPVLIIGGGLTGLAASVFLSWHGIPSLLVDQHRGTSSHPKARAINPRTSELLRSVGLEAEVLANRSPIADNTDLIHVHTLGGAERVRLPRPQPADIGRLSPCGWSLIDQNRLEPLLRQRAENAGGQVRYSVRAERVHIDAEGATVVLADRETGAEETVRTRYVIAADGNRSRIGGNLGVGHRGPGSLSHLVSFFFRADLTEAIRGRRIIAAYVNNDRVKGTFMPLDNAERWAFNVSYHPEKGETPDDFTVQRCIDLVRLGVGEPDLAVEIEGTDRLPWEIAGRSAETMRHGPVFIAGDAAHVMPPTGAFGASTGIQDAHNLAWKIAYVIRGMAGPELLDSYDTERRPIAELMVRQSMLRFEVREGRAFEEVAGEMLDELVMSFGYRYPAGAFTGRTGDGSPEDPADPSAAPGCRAPHVELVRAGRTLSTIDLFGRNFVLLGGTEAEWIRAAGARAADRGLPVETHLVGSGHELQDPQGRWAEAYRAGPLDAVLVRPDGFVAWRADGPQTEEVVAEALGSVLHLPAPQPTLAALRD
uniref:FAD-dependent monooxygenase n=1 Tax=uncultured bacterium BAC-AB1442/1414/561 TaxID=1562172 RepID=A0A0C4SD13_9BACT|nr:FAD-dependent monooxygenase [uncultured bacterium BAC-AB1442/1414/561]